MFRIKYSREAILKLLYLDDVLPEEFLSAEQLLRDNMIFFSLNVQEMDFVEKVVDKILLERETINETISRNLIGWKLERLLAVDRSLLRLGLGEAYFNDQKPVIIDDVIRLAKKYGGEDSYKIINAILDKSIG